MEKAKQSPDFGKPHDATLKFVSDDQVTLSGIAPGAAGAQAQSIDLKRVKE